MTKSKYVVTDGAFVWPKKSKAEAERSAKYLAKKNKYTTWVATPSKTAKGKLKVIKRYNP